MLKLLAPGYRRRLGSYRAADACELSSLGALNAPDEVSFSDAPDWRGYRVQKFTYPSPVDCLCEENRYVSGSLFWADDHAPWTVIVPGYATGTFPRGQYGLFQDVQARTLLERGINTALIDLPYHLTRSNREGISGEGFFTPDLHQMQSAFRQAAADVIALVRLLEDRSGRPVALWGTSLGGCVAGLVATQLPDLAAVALMEPLDNPGDTLAAIPGAREIREILSEHGFPPEELPAALRAVAPSSYRPLVPRERLLFVTPLWDRVVPTRFQEAFWESWGRPGRILVEAGHLTLAKNMRISNQVADFLARFASSTATSQPQPH